MSSSVIPGGTSPHGRWQSLVLIIASVQCLVWGIFMLLSPEKSSISYGFVEPPQELFLMQAFKGRKG